MNVLSIEFTKNWSWGVIFDGISKKTGHNIERIFMNAGDKIDTKEKDVVLCQNVTLLKKFTERLRTVCRMGGNQNFDDQKASKLEPLLKEMSKCYCIIATNQKLYDIAQAVNKRVYLIPNGIDLDEWGLLPQPEKRPFTVGFCGNITTPYYRDYKGFDFVEKACNNARVKLHQALYLDNQIPHDQMREKFYSQIDCIVHPTLGEGCSNTLMEAAACGIPIITTECAGFHGEKMVNGENVLFVNRSVSSVQKAIMDLRKDKELRKKLSLGARKFAENHHDIKVIAEQYDKIFKECKEYQAKAPIQVNFLSLINTPSGTTVVYNLNGSKAQSRVFPVGLSKEQIKAHIVSAGA